MGPAAKVSEFRKEGNDWFCSVGLPSDITVTLDGVNFHLHKFPLVSKCGKVARIYEESQTTQEKIFTITLEEFPGGPDTFLIVAKFCYGVRVEFTPKNILSIHCAADYLEMTNEYGEDNLLPKSENFFHTNILQNWKNCLTAIQSSEPVFSKAEKLHLVTKCFNSLSIMVCTDPSLFGWPMKMYGSLQSPSGSILWNGIHTGAKIQTTEPDWWFEDISYLSVDLFVKLINTMESKGIRPESLAGAIMHYVRKYLPGLGRWQSGKTRTRTRTVLASSVNQKALLETIEKLLPEKTDKPFCMFLLGLLRVGLILGVDRSCQDSLERRIGMQLELATLDTLLIPTYSDSDTLYDTDCVERIVHHFVASYEAEMLSVSPLERVRKVGRLVDGYIAEVASDVNLKPDKLRSLAEALPESSRPLHDGLYRALDIYFKEHNWLSEKHKEELCNIIDYQKLSIDACAHASQNKRLPLRVVLQVLFFEQLHLRAALTGCLVDNTEAAPTAADQIIQRDGWVNVVRENHVLKLNMEQMRSKVGELEQEVCKIKHEMNRVTKSRSSLSSSPRLVAKKFGRKLLPRSSDVGGDECESNELTTRTSLEVVCPSRHSRHRKSSSLF